MALEPGSNLLHYRLVEQIGEGGMGVVWRATDTKLRRDVAIKLLPGDFSQDSKRLARFEREAQVLASLNHVHIGAIYGLEQHDDQRFLVLELVDGEDLSQRLIRGPIPVDEVLQMCLQIADGLEAAHEQGVIHRDLKPANINVDPDGRVKILDFGLAKAIAPPGESETDSSNSPTITAADYAGTGQGQILGTAAYMSPEQARARPVDRRTDIWAFGCVAYEMLAGRRVFRGETALDAVTAVLKDEPDWAALPAATPAALRRLLQWCLRKEPKERLQHMGDARILISEIRDRGPVAENGVKPSLTLRSVPWKVAAPTAVALVLFGAVASWVVSRTPTLPALPVSAEWDLRPLTATGDAWNVALSRDGQTVAYLTSNGLVTHDTAGGSPNLVLPEPNWSLGPTYRQGQPIGEPQWLHDGSGVAFTVPIDATTMGISAVPRMGGEIIPKLATKFSGGEAIASFQSLPGNVFLLARVLENRQAAPWIRWMEGSEEEGIDVPQDITSLWDAVGSPDGRWIAYIGERADRTTVISTVSRDGSRHNLIAERGTELSKWAEISTTRQWAGNRIMRWPSGNRVYYRQMSSRGVDVHAITIDSDSGKAIGEPELVYSGLPPGASFDVAANGRRLVYSGGVIRTQIRLFRFDAEHGGDPIEVRSITRGTARHVAPRISPDGQLLAYIRKTRGSEDIYVTPVAGGEATPVNVLYRWNRLVDLKWAPGGDELAVFAETPNGPKLVIVSLSDARVRELAVRPVRGTWFDWSPDGRWIAYGDKADEVYVIHNLATGEEREILGELPGEKIQGLFSSDGAALLVNNVGLSSPGLWAKTLDGGPVRLVTAGAGTRTYPVRWSRAGLIYLLGPSGVILTVDAAGGTPREFGRTNETPVWDGWASISINGGNLYLACAVDEPRESDVWIADRVE